MSAQKHGRKGEENERTHEECELPHRNVPDGTGMGRVESGCAGSIQHD